jgi:hypothetical protein
VALLYRCEGCVPWDADYSRVVEYMSMQFASVFVWLDGFDSRD